MGGQVVEHDHIARYQGGPKDLVEVGGKYVPVNGPAHGHGRLQAVGCQGRDQRHVGTAVQGHPLAGALPAFGAGVTPAVGEVGAGLVHELKTRKVFLIAPLPQRPRARPSPARCRVRRRGGSFFSPPIQRLHGAPQRRAAGRRSATAASQMANSSSVASGVWCRQAVSWARAGASRRGAGPVRPSKAVCAAAGAVAAQQLGHEGKRNAELVRPRRIACPPLGRRQRPVHVSQGSKIA